MYRTSTQHTDLQKYNQINLRLEHDKQLMP